MVMINHENIELEGHLNRNFWQEKHPLTNGNALIHPNVWTDLRTSLPIRYVNGAKTPSVYHAAKLIVQVVLAMNSMKHLPIFV